MRVSLDWDMVYEMPMRHMAMRLGVNDYEVFGIWANVLSTMLFAAKKGMTNPPDYLIKRVWVDCADEWTGCPVLPAGPRDSLADVLVEAGLAEWVGDLLLIPEAVKRVVAYKKMAPREARKRESIPPRLRYAILRRNGFRCGYCGHGPGDGATLHVDHIMPVSRGGTNHPDNLIAACFDCNIGKGDRL